MKFGKNFLLVVALLAWTSVPTWAQDNDFDFSTQRGESQVVNHVPGKKIDHKGLIINPTPHEISVDKSAKLPFAQGFAIKDAKKNFTTDLAFLTQNVKGVKFSIDFGAKLAAKAKVKAVSGAYALNINKNGVSIIGYDEIGAFYGIKTLEQIIESEIAHDGTLPFIAINDYPDMKYRGVVEGFYGTPWSHEVRVSLINFYGRHKMNNYIFGPKDDPYHSSPNWRKPYPEKEAQNIKELVKVCRANRVNFVWAIHPGKDIRWNKQDYDSLVNKLDFMYDLGVRAFAIFFDDIEGEGTDSNKQVELLNNLDADFVKKKGDVANLMICPTDYSRLWASPRPNGQLATYGRKLNKSIEVFYTGDVVCSDLTKETMDFFNPLVQRPGLYWWNFPVSDYCRNYILQGPSYGLDTSLTENDVVGIESNPMEHGEASKVALYGVADYAWNIKDYNPLDNWERAIKELAPYAADAYRTFAIHNCDTETGYRRDESWETSTFRLKDYKPGMERGLIKLFSDIVKVKSQMELGCTNRGLFNELKPWLTEFDKLGHRGLRTCFLFGIYNSKNFNEITFWNAYVQNLMTDEEIADFNAHKVGTFKLQPFYENAMNDLVIDFYKKLTGEEATMYKGIGSFPNLATTQDRLMLDGDLNTFYTSAQSQRKNSWIGLDLKAVRDIDVVEIHQGRNSKNDVDYFDHATLEASVNGKEWVTLISDLQKTYDIVWTGEPVKARYVRLRRLDSKKTNYAAIRSFKVNEPTPERLGITFGQDYGKAALNAFDQNPSTTYKTTGKFEFARASQVKGYKMLLQLTEPIYFNQYNTDGKLVKTTAITQHFATVDLLPETAKISIDGPATIFELIPVK